MAQHARPSRSRLILRRGVRGGVLAVGASGLVATGAVAHADGNPPPRVQGAQAPEAVKSAHAAKPGQARTPAQGAKTAKKAAKARQSAAGPLDYNFSYTFGRSGSAQWHNTNGVFNLADNNWQAVLQGCNNNVPVNVLGVQVPLEAITGALALFGQDTAASAENTKACAQGAYQHDGEHGTDTAADTGAWAAPEQVSPAGAGGEFHNTNGLVNVADNNVQVPVQACNNYVPVNVGGVFWPAVQAAGEGVTGAAGVFSQGSVAEASNHKACRQGSGQVDGDSTPGMRAGSAAHRAGQARAARAARHAKPGPAWAGAHNMPAQRADAGPYGPYGAPRPYGGEFHNTNGLVNVSDNNVQVPVQACNNFVPVNVLGVQVPVENATAALGLFAQDTSTRAENTKSCAQGAAQHDGGRSGPDGFAAMDTAEH